MSPELAIICSSKDGGERLKRVAAELLARMDPELAARLARKCMLIALDGTRHAGFAAGLGGERDVTLQLAREQVKQGRVADESLVLIVINMDARHRPPSLEVTVAHELGHAALGHCDAEAVATEPLTDEQTDERERAADDFARLYVTQWGPVDTELR